MERAIAERAGACGRISEIASEERGLPMGAHHDLAPLSSLVQGPSLSIPQLDREPRHGLPHRADRARVVVGGNARCLRHAVALAYLDAKAVLERPPCLRGAAATPGDA